MTSTEDTPLLDGGVGGFGLGVNRLKTMIALAKVTKDFSVVKSHFFSCLRFLYVLTLPEFPLSQSAESPQVP